MRQELRNYVYEGATYPATITFKRMKSMTLRYDPEKKTLRVSCPNATRFRDIDAFVSRCLPKVTKKTSRKKSNYAEGSLYFLGEKREVGELTPEEIGAYYKKEGLPYLKERVDYWRKEMGVAEEYKVRMREMKRTFGSNSRRTKTLTFQTRLLAFCPEIIDSVIVHELAHHFQFDHSAKFYAIVYRYCPDYRTLRKKLIHDEFAG